ncbi:MAG TPA: LytTR family transcriptional regulator, partial [Beijerinckiaceae bacterium]
MDRKPALDPVRKFLAANPSTEILWIADGLEDGGARAFGEGLLALRGESGSVRALASARTPAAVASVENGPSGLEARLVRADANGRPTGMLRAYDLKGLRVGETTYAFNGEMETRARFDLPTELRNEIARVEIDGEQAAGAVSLLDSRWKRRRVAVVSGVTADVAQPLLSPTYYVTRALAPFADVREPRAGAREPVGAALDDQPSLVVLADVGVISGQARERLVRFVEDGGVLLRFAGTRLASSSDDLTPVRLRRGGRVLGGSLSWDTPRKLAPFDRASPFYGLDAIGEITVGRQVLAEPEAGLPGKTWAALDDGTPLITAAPRGKGMIVLVHVTADTTWSNLPLSGLFVDILRRIAALAGESADGAAQATSNAPQPGAQPVETAAPTRTLDGFGRLVDPPITAKPVATTYSGPAVADHPPGFYGPPNAMIAINALAPDAVLRPADLSGLDIEQRPLSPSEPVDLRPALIALAFLLFLADALASIWLAGGLRRVRRPSKAAT